MPPSPTAEPKDARQSGFILFPQRLDRAAFGIRMVVSISSCISLGLLVLMCWDALVRALPGIVSVPGLVFIVPMFAIYYAAVLLPRVRDTGLHGGFALLALVPPVNVIYLVALLFIPTDMFAQKSNET